MSSGPLADYTTVSSSVAYEGFNWAFDDISGDCSQPPEDVAVDALYWYRFKFDKPGYDPVFRYMNHDGFGEECDIMHCGTQDWVPGSCKSFDEVEMWATDGPVYDRLPDIFVDPRDVEDTEFQCVKMPSLYNPTDDKIQRVGLRISAGTANVGAGKFHVTDDVSGPGIDIGQLIQDSDDDERLVYVPGISIIDHPTHSHLHVEDWLQMRLIEDSSLCDDAPGTRPSWCDVREGDKLSFCLHDEQSFDLEIENEYDDHDLTFVCSDSTLQGISPGSKDVYGKSLTGQVIVLGTPPGMPAPGTYRIEVEWDPTGSFHHDHDKTNNRVQVEIEIPEFSTSDDLRFNEYCGDLGEDDESKRFLDCRGGYDVHDHCTDYLRCESHSDCSHGLTCQPGGDEFYCQVLPCFDSGDCEPGSTCQPDPNDPQIEVCQL